MPAAHRAEIYGMLTILRIMQLELAWQSEPATLVLLVSLLPKKSSRPSVRPTYGVTRGLYILNRGMCGVLLVHFLSLYARATRAVAPYKYKYMLCIVLYVSYCTEYVLQQGAVF